MRSLLHTEHGHSYVFLKRRQKRTKAIENKREGPFPFLLQPKVALSSPSWNVFCMSSTVSRLIMDIYSKWDVSLIHQIPFSERPLEGKGQLIIILSLPREQTGLCDGFVQPAASLRAMIFLRFPNLLLVPLGLLCMPGYSQQKDFCIHPTEVTVTWSSGKSYQHRCPRGSAQSGSSQRIWLSYWSQCSVWLLLGPHHWTADTSSCKSKHAGMIHVLLCHS